MMINKISGKIGNISWPAEGIRYRFQVLLRVLAGFIGGYILTGYMTAITALLLPMTRADAVVLSSMLSYLWFAGIIIWAFAVKSLLKLCLIVTMLIAAAATLYMALQSGTAG